MVARICHVEGPATTPEIYQIVVYMSLNNTWDLPDCCVYVLQQHLRFTRLLCIYPATTPEIYQIVVYMSCNNTWDLPDCCVYILQQYLRFTRLLCICPATTPDIYQIVVYNIMSLNICELLWGTMKQLQVIVKME